MTRRFFCKVLLVAVAVFGLLALSSILLAQGRSEEAFERVRQVQEHHTARLMAIKGVEGTAIGLDENDALVVKVFTAGPGVRGIPKELEGVPVRPVVTGKIYALKPPSSSGRDKKNPPPAAPTGLTAAAVSDIAIDLAWNKNSEDNLARYNVYRSATPGGPYTRIGSAPIVDEPAYSDTGLTAETTYYYVVTAVDTSGKGKESDNSNEASDTTGDAPDGPPAIPANLTATAVSSSQIDLTWQDTDNETGFRIESMLWPIATVGANVTSYSSTGLNHSTPYTYRVHAYNSAGASKYSNTASATTDPPPDKPPLWCERPVPIGVSTGHPNVTAGTIGCRVTDGGNVYALSNNHVYANSNRATIGDNVLQPGSVDGGLDPDHAIGTLADFEPIEFSRGARNEIDAAIAEIIIDVVDEAEIPRVGTGTPAGGYGTPSSTIVGAVLYQPVQKYGRTTEFTQGEITGVNVTVRVGYGLGKTAKFVKQIMVESGTRFIDGGDSGSLLVTNDSNRNPVGLLFAGNSAGTMAIANRIDLVLGRFGVTIDGE